MKIYNNYDLYTLQGSLNFANLNEDYETEAIRDFIKNFSKLENINEAKAYLQETFGVTEGEKIFADENSTFALKINVSDEKVEASILEEYRVFNWLDM